MSYKLMIKTHNITNLKYLCITSRDDYISYTGSGSYWKNHISKYGNYISTELLYETEDYEDFLIHCLYYSNILNVALSEEFANMVPETGYNNNDGKPNVVLFWEYASDEVKNEIIKRRSSAIKENHWTKNEDIRDIIVEKISIKNTERWDSLTLDERRCIIERLNNGFRMFCEDRDSEKYISWKEKISESLKDYCNNNKEKISKRNKLARLNTSKESKERRKMKIREVYNSGKHDNLFKRYSKERLGSGNPAAKPIEIDGVVYGSVQEASRETGTPAHTLYRMRRKA